MARHMVFIYECEYCGTRTEPMQKLPATWSKLHGKYEVCGECKDVDFVKFVERQMEKVR